MIYSILLNCLCCVDIAVDKNINQKETVCFFVITSFPLYCYWKIQFRKFVCQMLIFYKIAY